MQASGEMPNGCIFVFTGEIPKMAKQKDDEKSKEDIQEEETQETETVKQPDFYDELTPEQKKQYDAKVAGLKSALEGERGLLKAANKQIDQTKRAKELAVQRQLEEQGKWEEVSKNQAAQIAELEPQAARLDAYEATLDGILEAQVAELPEHVRSFVPEALSTHQQLEWLAQNKQQLMKPTVGNIGATATNGAASRTDGVTVTLTQDEAEMAKHFNMTPEEYAKFK
jgi:chromosome segregation ATPase